MTGEVDAASGSTFVLASANVDKAAEIVAILAVVPGLTLLPRPVDVPDVEETGETLEGSEKAGTNEERTAQLREQVTADPDSHSVNVQKSTFRSNDTFRPCAISPRVSPGRNAILRNRH